MLNRCEGEFIGTCLSDEELVPGVIEKAVTYLREAINEVPGLHTAYHGLPDQFCAWYRTAHDIRKQIALDPAGIRQAVAGFAAGR